ncbi:MULTISPECIES: AAA family ATPase [Ruminococcus]|uniref:ATPase associated with various cellular activities AAA_3 n=1 Tax=Ruminococcus albus (strain ATCC 27210 / DSM 20455 / JCM 14654 / NCDO 2250 / 7) TaxID=697329 RepID=E6UID5_RUMA7|nr:MULTISPECIES: MoxR family ATPase [Ruminococcus]ADU22196.1 ATPase associated with various cellular activities AAA_3 [Ruminococcus albus 7 = DSM 20455]MCR5020678.1 MoxR family ATPase [Ruminococcus sp.]
MSNNLTEGQRAVLAMSQNVIGEVKKVIIGKDEIIIKVLLSILAGGHILIEDIPGVGKTTLAVALSKALSLEYKRLQFTPDVLPTDVTGFNILNKQTQRFEYKPGAALTNLFLADEINRTSSKTQSALLEIMEEGKVTVDGVTRKAPDPYIVIATQNPIGSIGTQMLPESQMDRFIVRLTMGYPSVENEVMMLKAKQSLVPVDSVRPVVSAEDIVNARHEVENIYVADQVIDYIARLAAATRNHQFIKLGLSPRGTIALLRMTKATALLKGRDYVIPDDVAYTFNDVVLHRVVFNSKAKINGVSGEQVLREILSTVEVPRVAR